MVFEGAFIYIYTLPSLSVDPHFSHRTFLQHSVTHHGSLLISFHSYIIFFFFCFLILYRSLDHLSFSSLDCAMENDPDSLMTILKTFALNIILIYLIHIYTRLSHYTICLFRPGRSSSLLLIVTLSKNYFFFKQKKNNFFQ